MFEMCIFFLSEVQFIIQYEARILNCIARAFGRALTVRICSSIMCCSIERKK